MSTQTPQRFRKKPVVIEAVQWFKMGDHSMVESYAHADGMGQEELGCIKTLESGRHGMHIVSIGDWIIKGVKGEYYACKPDIFEQTYEAADLTTKQWILDEAELRASRDHYKALCEELREAVESAQIAFHFQAIRDAQDAKMCAGWVLLQDQMSAALKKAQKDI
jgi:hypothetical protein